MMKLSAAIFKRGNQAVLTREKVGFIVRVAHLTSVQKERLSTWLDENLCLNVGEILQYLRKMYGVFLSRSHMCRLLRELGFVYKKIETCGRISPTP